ncbi:hypothetical protein RCL_jg26178.t1 [Rhizophagus clarus]|uniref:Uncharacterized protein n=1 Tax=Rhizophagus clarus TaxID=94130 RepID=A0A8H3KT97_9GLOM|nr:hypothetical protein RCL_jg26178.t1 [Rhizophagus clarus]
MAQMLTPFEFKSEIIASVFSITSTCVFLSKLMSTAFHMYGLPFDVIITAPNNCLFLMFIYPSNVRVMLIRFSFNAISIALSPSATASLKISQPRLLQLETEA